MGRFVNVNGGCAGGRTKSRYSVVFQVSARAASAVSGNMVRSRCNSAMASRGRPMWTRHLADARRARTDQRLAGDSAITRW